MTSPALAASALAAGALRLLAADRRSCTDLPARVIACDSARRGAVVARAPAGAVRRAEPGPFGPLVWEARPHSGAVVLEIWGPSRTPATVVDSARAAAAAWIGCADDRAGFGEVVAGQPVLRELHRRLGTPPLSRVPRVGEAVGRAVVAQLVQTLEARRSTAQLAALVGTPAASGLWCWPTARQLGATPAWALRRCGVSLRGARALHAAAVADGRLSEAVPALVDRRCATTMPDVPDGPDGPDVKDVTTSPGASALRGSEWELLDRRLRALPGIGVWTSAETRLALGDPDAVSVGDYNLPALVGHVLGGGDGDGEGGAWTDEGMLALLAPYAGQRGRVIRLVVRGLVAGLVRGPARRAPRAALSQHRYW